MRSRATPPPTCSRRRSTSGWRAITGGLDHTGTLVSGTPEAVREEARAAISATDGLGLLLAPGCSVPPEAPEENLRAITQMIA